MTLYDVVWQYQCMYSMTLTVNIQCWASENMILWLHGGGSFMHHWWILGDGRGDRMQSKFITKALTFILYKKCIRSAHSMPAGGTETSQQSRTQSIEFQSLSTVRAWSCILVSFLELVFHFVLFWARPCWLLLKKSFKKFETSRNPIFVALFSLRGVYFTGE